MKKIVLVLLFACLPLSLFAQEIVEKIEILGNERVTRETILYYLSSREGDHFNEDLLRRDFRVLWSTGFFSNIKIEKENGATGRVIKITVEENPVIKDIVYKTGKKLKEDDIIEKLKENDEYILPYSYYSPYKVQRIEKTIKDLLVEKGLTAGEVKVEINKKGKNEVEIVFDIKEGPKIRIGKIVFEGKPKLRNSTLKGSMKENKKHNLISWILGKDTFKINKLDEDLASLKKKYKEQGYMEATIGEPRIEEITKRSIFFKKQQMKNIIIPVDAGYRYFVGDVKIEGNKIISSKYLRSLIGLKEGKVYSTKVREEAVKDIQELYQDAGYLYAQIMPVESLDPKRKRVNVTFNIYEGEVAYLRRIEFRGNTYTKDKVIRREFLIREGDRFIFSFFKNSLLRIGQLGLVELEKDPEIKPDPEDPTQFDVTVNVRELQRNNIQFTAGYSGYQGTFIALSYSTVNFLGAGETLELMLQHGKRIKNYMFGFSEPYVFDLPLNVGFNVYNRRSIYPGLFNQKSQGIDFQLGARVKGFLRTNLTYSFQYLTITIPTEEEDDVFDPYYNPFSYYGGYGGMYGPSNYFMSSITPMIYRSTIDSPLTPSRGTLYLVSCKFAGGILGGDISLIKPRFEWTLYQPTFKNHSIGFHIEYQFTKPIGDSEVPFWERYFLGGERSIRGYDIYTIGPRSPEGSNVGGEKSFVFNSEYIIPIGEALYAILFYDAGNAFAHDRKVNFKNLYTSTGLEMRIFIPALRVPFRLIFSYNNRMTYRDDSKFAFRFAIGTTF